MSTELLLCSDHEVSKVFIDTEEDSTVDRDLWHSFYSPPDPLNLNESQEQSTLLSNPLYSCFTVQFPNIGPVYKDERGPKGNRMQRIVDGKVEIHVLNPIVFPAINSENEFTFSVSVKREAGSLIVATRQASNLNAARKQASNLNVAKKQAKNDENKGFVEEEVLLEGIVVEMQAMPGNNGGLGGCEWKITTDLDSVFTNDEGRQVYKLCMGNSHLANMFQLVVRIYQTLSDEHVYTVAYKESEPFLVKSKPRRQGKSSLDNSPEPVAGPSESPRNENGFAVTAPQVQAALDLVQASLNQIHVLEPEPAAGPSLKRPRTEHMPTMSEVQRLSQISPDDSPEPVPVPSSERPRIEHGPTIPQVQAALDVVRASLDRILDSAPAGSSLERPPDTEHKLTVPQAIADYIEAKQAFIDELEIGKPIKTKRKDIAYNFILKDPTAQFNEGDVVVFVEASNKQTVIELLTQDNYKNAKLAGVISRSNFISAALPDKPSEDIKTDVVCIIGIVKVKVHGPVRNGEHLYASPKRPGVALTEATYRLMRSDADIKPFFLAQAIEAANADDIYEEHLVSSFVSIVLGIERLASAKRLETYVHNVNKKFKIQMKKAGTMVNCKIFWTVIALLLILTGIGLGIWQRYAPNTLYWRSECRKGWIEGHHICISYKNKWDEVYVHGIEFTFENLEKKLYRKVTKHPGKDMQYFINFDRCINRGVTYANEYLDNGRTISGPEVMASDCQSKKVFYFINGHWESFKRIKNNVTCLTSTPNDNVLKTCHGDDDT